ncbi:MAG: glutamine hydrolyzing CTP synthase [Candidatus Aenigmatarchaeota archaeon]
MTKYVFVTGGVMSGLGKGIVASSIGRLLKSRGFNVTAVKIDPYVNVDAGTMRPTEHGEVWVTDDGGEIDQDFGHYERFLGDPLKKDHNITTGQIYREVISRERRGDYLGKTVQVIPHVTNEIRRRIESAAKESNAEICLIEIGGTVGDYENVLFLEAARQMKRDLACSKKTENSVVFVHVSYVPIPTKLGEPKTKLTQQSVKQLREIGINADFIVCRSSAPLDEVRKGKIALFCDVRIADIISNPDLDTVYALPREFEKQGFADRLVEKLGLEEKLPDSKEWDRFVEVIRKGKTGTKVGIVGKYIDSGDFSLTDAYISVEEAVRHAGAKLGLRPEIVWVNSKGIEKGILNEVSGIIVPGGFGSTGIEGKINAIKFARENDLPFLGLCLGLQTAVIEFARNVCGLTGAHSTEIDPKTKNPVVDILPEQKNVSEKGATMRLGTYPAVLKSGTNIEGFYKTLGRLDGNVVHERHRHRYEVNPDFHKILQERGLVFSGTSPDGRLVEFIELPNHKCFIATQAHPEFKSTLLNPAPMFYGFMNTCAN